MNSSILSKTLEEGSWIKKIIFWNTDNLIDSPDIHISFSENTLTIDWSKINPDYYLNYLIFLLELWPGLILRLKILKDWDWEKLDFIKRLLIYCEGSPHCWKLSFSKVVIDIDKSKIDITFFVILNKLKHLYDFLFNIYDVELENITYEDLFIKLF